MNVIQVADLLFFVVDNQTRSVVSLCEIAYLVGMSALYDGIVPYGCHYDIYALVVATMVVLGSVFRRRWNNCSSKELLIA